MCLCPTWEKRDDSLLGVFLPSLDWELVKNLHLREEKHSRSSSAWLDMSPEALPRSDVLSGSKYRASGLYSKRLNTLREMEISHPGTPKFPLLS